MILPTRKECNHGRPPKSYRERSIGSLEGAAQTSFCGRFPEIPSILQHIVIHMSFLRLPFDLACGQKNEDHFYIAKIRPRFFGVD